MKDKQKNESVRRTLDKFDEFESPNLAALAAINDPHKCSGLVTEGDEQLGWPEVSASAVRPDGTVTVMHARPCYHKRDWEARPWDDQGRGVAFYCCVFKVTRPGEKPVTVPCFVGGRTIDSLFSQVMTSGVGSRINLRLELSETFNRMMGAGLDPRVDEIDWEFLLEQALEHLALHGLEGPSPLPCQEYSRKRKE